MSAGRAVVFTDVSEQEFAELSEYLRDVHDLTVTVAGDLAHITGQHLQGTLAHSVERAELRIELEQHPRLVTPGYLLGLLYDEMAETRPADRSN
jgi:hypothetical protein